MRHLNLLRFMVSPEARVQFSDSQRFKELSSILPIDKRRSKQGRSTGRLRRLGDLGKITRGGSLKRRNRWSTHWKRDLKSGEDAMMKKVRVDSRDVDFVNFHAVCCSPKSSSKSDSRFCIETILVAQEMAVCLTSKWTCSPTYDALFRSSAKWISKLQFKSWGCRSAQDTLFRLFQFSSGKMLLFWIESYRSFFLLWGKTLWWSATTQFSWIQTCLRWGPSVEGCGGMWGPKDVFWIHLRRRKARTWMTIYSESLDTRRSQMKHETKNDKFITRDNN